MHYLLLAILFNVGIFLCFRLFTRWNVSTFHAIVVNYITCVITGILFSGAPEAWWPDRWDQPWLPIALLLGFVFIVTFFLMARTTQEFSMTVASVSSKMSLIIPIVVSLFVLKVASKPFMWYNYVGIVLALVAIVFTSLRNEKNNNGVKANKLLFLYPIIVFFMGGVIDTALNYANFHYVKGSDTKLFPIVIFCIAASIGITTLVLKKSAPRWNAVLGGVILGAINYFSIYFILLGLTYFSNDGAIVYPVLNIGIIVVSMLVSVLLFKEKLLRINRIGIVMAVCAVILLFYQEVTEVLTQ